MFGWQHRLNFNEPNVILLSIEIFGIHETAPKNIELQKFYVQIINSTPMEQNYDTH
jgi:hypothetical protein